MAKKDVMKKKNPFMKMKDDKKKGKKTPKDSTKVTKKKGKY